MTKKSTERFFRLALIVAVTLAIPNFAWASFFDTPLVDGGGFDSNVDNSTGGAVAITSTYVNRHGTKIRKMQIITVPAGATISYTTEVMPKNSTSGVFVDVEPLPGNTLGLDFKQGAIRFSQSCQGDCRITFDVAPAP